jgi:type I restriction enzyme S subunit
LKDGIIRDSAEKITPAALKETSAKLFPVDTVLMAMYGDGKTITSLGVLGIEAATNQACCAMITDQSRCLPRFLFYALRHHRKDFIHIATGGAQRNLSGSLIRRFAIGVPPLDEQATIVRVLGSLDDKIELNRKMNETLEAMARALFKSWFVDFDPVRAKAEGRDPELPSHIAALFPESFEDSDLGEIPRGWNTKTIGDLAIVQGGSTPSTKEESFWKGGTHYWATPKDLSALSTPVLLETERQITNTGLAQISSGLLPVGTVLLSSRAPIGYLAVAQVPIAVNQGFVTMRPKEGVSNLFLLWWTETAHDVILGRANGSTFLEISKANFRPIPVVVPPPPIMNVFDRTARPLYERIVLNEREARNLIDLRDALLPKLISGEVRVAPDSRCDSLEV